MDIYSYLNSPDVAEHCRKLNHPFNALESAFIVNDCLHISVQEKHRLFREIMETMPDVQIDRFQEHHMHDPSLFVCLEKQIKAEEACLRALKTGGTGKVYTYSGYHVEANWEFKSEKWFSTYSKMVEAMKTDMEEEENGTFSFKIRMLTIDSDDEVTAWLNHSFEIFRIEQNYDDFYDTQFLNDVWVYIPIPFQKGDLVCGIGDSTFYCLMKANDPIVLRWLCYWDREEGWIDRRKQTGDSCDMTAYGYWLDCCGNVYDECVHAYHNLQYYRGDIQPKQRKDLHGYTRDLRLLKAISAYMKGEINVNMLLIANDAIRTERQWKEVFPGWDYLEEVYEKAGIGDIYKMRKVIEKHELKEDGDK